MSWPPRRSLTRSEVAKSSKTAWRMVGPRASVGMIRLRLSATSKASWSATSRTLGSFRWRRTHRLRMSGRFHRKLKKVSLNRSRI
ncbi:hypothetical protein [Streptomyces xantholiticus]